MRMLGAARVVARVPADAVRDVDELRALHLRARAVGAKAAHGRAADEGHVKHHIQDLRVLRKMCAE